MTTTISNLHSCWRGRVIALVVVSFIVIYLPACGDSGKHSEVSSTHTEDSLVTSDSSSSKEIAGEASQVATDDRLRKFETEAYRLSDSSQVVHQVSDSIRLSKIIGRGYLGARQVPTGVESNSVSYVSVMFEPLSSALANDAIVTVIPADSSLTPANVRLNRTRRIESCSGRRSQEWNPESVLVRRGENPDFSIRDDKDHGFYVVYPPVAKVDLLSDSSLAVPGRFSPKTVDVAIDFNKDSIADVIAVSYCCERPDMPSDASIEPCSSCASSFVWKEGDWQETWTSRPC